MQTKGASLPAGDQTRRTRVRQTLPSQTVFFLDRPARPGLSASLDDQRIPVKKPGRAGKGRFPAEGYEPVPSPGPGRSTGGRKAAGHIKAKIAAVHSSSAKEDRERPDARRWRSTGSFRTKDSLPATAHGSHDPLAGNRHPAQREMDIWKGFLHPTQAETSFTLSLFNREKSMSLANPCCPIGYVFPS